MTDLNSVLEAAAARYADHPAVRMDGLVLSYCQLRDAAYRTASLLASLGIVPGDRVALMLPNVPAFPIAFYGALAAGAIAVPMYPLLKSREIAYHLSDSGASVLLAWHTAADEVALGAAGTGVQVLMVDDPGAAGLLTGLAPVAPVPAGRAGNDDAAILYTSGTTGMPKGAELTHANLACNASLTARTLLCAGPEDVVMGCLPLFHVFGLTCALNAAVAAGASLTLLHRFDPAKALESIGRDKVTIFAGDPTTYAAMLHDPAGAPGGHLLPARVRIRRLGPAGPDHAQVRAGLRVHDPGGLRAYRDLPRRVVQPPRPGAQARIDRHAGGGGPDAGRRCRRRRGRLAAPGCSPARSARSSSAGTT